MKLNPDKCKLLVCGHKYEVMIGNVAGANVIESHNVRLLGIRIDSDLRFNEHVKSICKKASNKLSALSRLCTILPLKRRKTLMHAFFISQFSYCPLI